MTKTMLKTGWTLADRPHRRQTNAADAERREITCLIFSQFRQRFPKMVQISVSTATVTSKWPRLTSDHSVDLGRTRMITSSSRVFRSRWCTRAVTWPEWPLDIQLNESDQLSWDRYDTSYEISSKKFILQFAEVDRIGFFDWLHELTITLNVWQDCIFFPEPL